MANSAHSRVVPLDNADERAFARKTDCEHSGSALRGLLVAVALATPFWILLYLLAR